MMRVTTPERGFDRALATRAVASSRLPELFAAMAPGAFTSTSANGARALEVLRDAVDVALAAREATHAVILEHVSAASANHGFALPGLSPEHHMFLACVQVVVCADVYARGLERMASLGPVEGQLELEGLPDLLALEQPPERLMIKLLELAGAYTKLKVKIDEATGAPGLEVAAGVRAFLGLIRASVLRLSEQSRLRALTRALEREGFEVAGFMYKGLQVREVEAGASSGLLRVWPDDIVGNQEYLSAGLRLARDVAGYDFDAGRNPKRINPVLFGLGRPGCGKTVTAHAIGNEFLRYCEEREIPAKFLVIQRTDWASSYQNASALNLVRMFREQVHAFDGVCGIYWPDIDTAFASRDSGQLRSEEKQNLGAVFGVFDGTLLPKNGKWFLICDANTLHMDEATVSRIAQNPMTVTGPTTWRDYVSMMRDLQLADIADFIDVSDEEWEVLGELAVELDLSGRNLDAISGNVRAYVQDFEYPDEYFTLPRAEREAMITSLCKRATASELSKFMREWSAFRRDADSDAEEERFEREVEALVRRLNASRVASAMMSSPEGE